MEELNVSEVAAVSGGDGVETTAGILVGVAAGALVIGTGGGILVGGLLGGAIFSFGSFYLRRYNVA